MLTGIVGGGITGLTTALALRKFGLPSVVFEQATERKEVGAGIWIQPNAMRIFDQLGIGDRVRDAGTALITIEVTDTRFNPFRRMKSEGAEGSESNEIIAIHRAKLLDVLFQEVQKHTQIRMGKRYVKHTAHGAGVSVTFEDEVSEVDCLLGADGTNSRVRESIAPNATLRSAGQVCWRGISKVALPNSLYNRGIEAWGKQKRFGFSQLDAGRVYWFAVVSAALLGNATTLNDREAITHFFKEFSPTVSTLVANTDVENIHRATLQDLNRLSTWYGHRVCLLGDAAHATTPNMGQGACQGIEDAYYISKLMSRMEGDPTEAFALFQRQRRKKVDHVVNTSWRIGKLAHSSGGQAFMKFLFRVTPDSVMKRQMKNLYQVDL